MTLHMCVQCVTNIFQSTTNGLGAIIVISAMRKTSTLLKNLNHHDKNPAPPPRPGE